MSASRRCLLFAVVIALSFVQPVLGEPPKTMTPARAQALVRQYLAEQDAEKKQKFLEEAGDAEVKSVTPLARYVVPSRYPPARPGVYHEQQLPLPAEVSDKPGRFSISIPNGYNPRRAWPLVISLHGGGANIGFGKDDMESNVEIARLPVVLVCPDTLDRSISKFWRNPINEEMLRYLIKHVQNQVAIDRDHVYLVGYSMGGIGIYYLGPRLSELFAGIGPGGGAWKGVYWASLLNTPMYIWHGKRDMRGKQFTNYDYAVEASKIMGELKDYPWTLRTMDSDHANIPNGEHVLMMKWLSQFKRDPYPKRIVLSSPRAVDFSGLKLPAPPDRWLAIDEIGTEKLVMPGVETGGAARKDHNLPMGILDAKWTDKNKLEVDAQNVVSFRVLLSPELVDFSKPLEVQVNGKQVFAEEVHSSLAYAMKYLDEHRDPSMIFVGEVTIRPDAKSPATTKPAPKKAP